MSTARVVIVGGGLAGLTAAHRLLHPRADAARTLRPTITLLEAEARPGGKIRTDCLDGFVIDAGPDSFLSTKPWALELVRELGLESELIGVSQSARRAAVRRGERLHPLPPGMTGLVPGRASSWLRAGVLSWPGRLRALLDLVMPAGPHAAGDESIAAFARRRFGREACDWLLEPLLAGIHGGHASRLGIRATFPELVEAEARAGSVLRGLRAARASPPAAHPLGAFLTFRRGLQRLIDALAQSIAACDVQLGTAAARVERAGDAWRVVTQDGRAIDAEALILAVPAHAAAHLIQPVADALSRELAAIPFADSTVVHLACDAPRNVPLTGSGYLNPPAGGRAVTACTWSSVKFEGRAPAGALLVRAFLKDDAARMPDDAAAEAAHAEVASILPLDGRPHWHRVYRFPTGMPQYDVGHTDRLQRIEQELRRWPGLFVAGHSYRGIGIPDTIRSGDAAAASALRHMTATA